VGGGVLAVVEHEQRVTGTPGIDGLVLRYGMLYGPGTYHDRRGSTSADILAGRVPVVAGAPGMYSWLHAADAASAAVAALDRGAPGIYNVVDDEPAPQPEWLPALARALGADPPPAAETPPPPYALEMTLRGASNAKAKRELGWRPRYPSWREGFAASLA
jgi:nucleoside-diphosphate-sugar epimerase